MGTCYTKAYSVKYDVFNDEFDWAQTSPEVFTNRHERQVRRSEEYRQLRDMQRWGMTKELQLAFWKRTASAMNPDMNAHLEIYKNFWNDAGSEDYKEFTFGYGDWKSEVFRQDDKFAVQRVLLTFAVLYDNVTYCPLLTCAVVLFFSLGLEEAVVFDLCSSMILVSLKGEHSLNFRTNSTAFLKDVELAIQILPNALKKWASIWDINLENIITGWFVNFFKSILPNELRMRMFQIWAFEGSKIKFRIVVGLLRCYQSKLLTLEDKTAFNKTLRHCIQDDMDSLGVQQIINQILGLNVSAKKLTLQLEKVVDISNIKEQINQLEDATITFPDFENGDSAIISKRHLYMLWGQLPNQCRMYCIKREFVASRHGYSLIGIRNKVLLQRSYDYAGMFMIFLKTKKNEVFGCFLNPPARWKGKEFATTNLCLFSILPSLECYSFEENAVDERSKAWCEWSRLKFTVGGTDGPGFEFNSTLNDGRIWPGKDFRSSVFTSKCAYDIINMELWVMTLGLSDYDKPSTCGNSAVVSPRKLKRVTYREPWCA